jgi:hypothetical protein
MFLRRKKTTPYATRAADVYRLGPTNESETPLFDATVLATGTWPEQPYAVDIRTFARLDALAAPLTEERAA